MKLDAKNVTGTADVVGGAKPMAGRYLAIVTEVDDSRTKKDGTPGNSTVVSWEILGGTTPGQEGRKLTQYLHLNDSGEETDKHLRFALATGILEPGKARDDIDLESEGPNKLAVIEVAEFPTKDGKKDRGIGDYGMAIWHLKDKDAEPVLKIKAVAAALKTALGGNTEKQKATEQPEPATAGAVAASSNGPAAADEWADV